MPAIGRLTPLRPYRGYIVVAVISLALTTVFSTAVLAGPWDQALITCACPAAWALGPPSNESYVQPGSVACQGLAGESCYEFELISTIAGVHLSGLRFEVLGPPWNSTDILNSPQVALGQSARVTALGTAGTVVGAWNWSMSSWSQGGDWTIPVSTNVTLVLDTGFQNARLSGDFFETFMETPNYGAVGASL